MSVVLPVFNRPERLLESVESVRGQTYPFFELIIVDDGSTDQTPEVIAHLERRYPSWVRMVRQENQGVAVAREAGTAVARGEFLQYLDSDDRLLPCKFELQVAALLADPAASAAYGRIRLVDERGVVISSPYNVSGRVVTQDRVFPEMLCGLWLDTVSPLYRRAALDPGSWGRLRIYEDWVHAARLGAKSARLVPIPDIVADVVQHPGPRLTNSLSAEVMVAARSEMIPEVYRCARQAGVEDGTREMRAFSRFAFLTARQAAALGRLEEFRACLEVASRAGNEAVDVRVFTWLESVLGAQRLGRAAAIVDRLRRNLARGSAGLSRGPEAGGRKR